MSTTRQLQPTLLHACLFTFLVFSLLLFGCTTSGLPPDPGPRGDETTEGVDSDNDGVRDDIERYIVETYGNDKSLERVLLEFARIAQRMLIEPTEDDLSESTGRQNLVIGCLTETVGDGARALHILKDVEAEFVNTRSRLAAYIALQKKLSGRVYKEPEPSELATFCEQLTGTKSNHALQPSVSTLNTCKPQNKTAVYYASGMFNTWFQAMANLHVLTAYVDPIVRGNRDETEFKLAYNQDEVLFVQLLEVAAQRVNVEVSDLLRWLAGDPDTPEWFKDWLETALKGLTLVNLLLDEDLQRQVQSYTSDAYLGNRILTVAHSQGNFYANAVYDILGEVLPDFKSASLLSVATPDSRVARNGAHLTLHNDVVIAALTNSAFPSTLNPNAINAPPYLDWKNHSFVTAYLVGNSTGPKIYTAFSTMYKTTPFPEADPDTGNCPFEVPKIPCNSCGDPHFSTKDFLHYDLQIHGELSLVRSADGNLEIQVRQQPFKGSTRVTVNTAFAARVNGDRVMLTVKGELFVNGEAAALTDDRLTLPGGGEIIRTGSRYTVRWPDGALLSASIPSSGYMNIGVHLPDSYKGKVRGLLGNFNGDPADDLITREGKPMGVKPSFQELYKVFGESWRVKNSLFTYAEGQTTEDYTDRDFPRLRATSKDLSPAQLAFAQTACAGISDPVWYEACLVDVGFTGDASFADALADLLPPLESVSVSVPFPGSEYANDFESEVGAEWSVIQRDTTPIGGRQFLGQFGNGDVTLDLVDLPPHTQVTVTFDLYVLRSWDGAGRQCCGPDVWTLSIGDEVIINTTFSNGDGQMQHYPGEVGDEVVSDQTGASERNVLGYEYGVPRDAVYRISRTVSHSDDSLSIRFGARGLQGLSDESWGLDNVSVTLE